MCETTAFCPKCNGMTEHWHSFCVPCLKEKEIVEVLRESHSEIHDELDIFNPNSENPLPFPRGGESAI